MTIRMRNAVSHGHAALPVDTPITFYDKDIEKHLIEYGLADETDEKPELTITKKMIETPA